MFELSSDSKFNPENETTAFSKAMAYLHRYIDLTDKSTEVQTLSIATTSLNIKVINQITFITYQAIADLYAGKKNPNPRVAVGFKQEIKSGLSDVFTDYLKKIEYLNSNYGFSYGQLQKCESLVDVLQ